MDEEIITLQKAITYRAARLGAKKIGFADLSATGHPLASRFPSGIALVLPMDPAIVGGDDEPKLFEHQVWQLEKLEAIKASLGELLASQGYGFHSVGNDHDPITLAAELSHKMVANLAGLGWVGKSTLFVTPEYGPRIRLTSLLTDARFSARSVPLASKCGDCDRCAASCPADAIKNVSWTPGIARGELLDVGRCADYRHRMGDGSRDYRCARCLNACPRGE